MMLPIVEARLRGLHAFESIQYLGLIPGLGHSVHMFCIPLTKLISLYHILHAIVDMQFYQHYLPLFQLFDSIRPPAAKRNHPWPALSSLHISPTQSMMYMSVGVQYGSRSCVCDSSLLLISRAFTPIAAAAMAMPATTMK